jgi:hypothetical protein
LKSGEITRTHIFTIEKIRGATKIFKQDDNDAEDREDDVAPRNNRGKAVFKSAQDRAPLIKNMLNELQNLEPPGIQPIKQVDLFTKWRKLLKPENQDKTCPKPADDVLEGERTRKRNKTRAVTAKKKEGRDSVNH